MWEVESTQKSAHYQKSGQTLAEMVHKINTDGIKYLVKEHQQILASDKQYPATASESRPELNRWGDIKCWDHSRVKLSPPQDYIHANYVDGYLQPRKFICTQGPLENTIKDFWRMVWQEGTVVIVSLTKVGGTKCECYWPPNPFTAIAHGFFKIQNTCLYAGNGYTMTNLSLSQPRLYNNNKVRRKLALFLYYEWPDQGVPDSTSGFLDFIETINKKWKELSNQEHCKYAIQKPPIVVHCSAGIGRTGTLVAIDIGIERLHNALANKTTPMVEIVETIKRLRIQRAMAIQRPEQYLFVHIAILQFCLRKGLLNPTDLNTKNFMKGLNEESTRYEID